MVTGCPTSNNGEHEWKKSTGYCDTCGGHDYWSCDSCFETVDEYGSKDDRKLFEEIARWMSSRNQSSGKS